MQYHYCFNSAAKLQKSFGILFAFEGKSKKSRAQMARIVTCALRNCRVGTFVVVAAPKFLPLPFPHDLAEGDDKFIHILAGVVEGKGGTDAHLVAEGSEGGLGAVVTSTHCDALLI